MRPKFSQWLMVRMNTELVLCIMRLYSCLRFCFWYVFMFLFYFFEKQNKRRHTICFHTHSTERHTQIIKFKETGSKILKLDYMNHNPVHICHSCYTKQSERESSRVRTVIIRSHVIKMCYQVIKCFNKKRM